jgi:acetyltransferase-like isoleucine patch superfamily enzyme
LPKRAFFVFADGLVPLVDRLAGEGWRRFYRPHSATVTEHLRVLRFIMRRYRFDSAGPRCALGRRVRFWGPVSIHIGERCGLFDDVAIWGRGTLRIGDRSTLGHGTVVAVQESVEIGRDVMVAGRCYILDVDHGFARQDVAVSRQDLRIEPVRIEDDVWVGAGSAILRGVTIGRGAIIGANSVVTRDVPPYTIAAGNPAAVIGTRGARD